MYKVSVPSSHPISPFTLNKPLQEFIEAVDGIDNGVEQYIDEAGKPAKARYRSGTGLSSRVGHLNPAWNQPSGPEVYDVGAFILSIIYMLIGCCKLQAQFAKASELTGGEFLSRLDYYGNAWLPARSLVADALVKRFEADPSGQIIAFSTYLPWKVRSSTHLQFSLAQRVLLCA
jgi:uncharacterized UPF0160 family protein